MNQRKIGTVLQYAQMALSILISIVYTPVMLRILGQGEYGIYSLASSIISYLSLLSLGFGASYMRFYARYKADNNRGISNLNGLFMTVFTVIAIVAFCAGVVLAFNVNIFFNEGYTQHDMEIAKILMLFMAFNLAIEFPASVFTSYVTSQEKFLFQKALNIGKTVLGPMITLPVLLLGYGSIGMVVVTTVVTVSVDILNAFFCLKKLKMKFSFKEMELSLFKEIAAFSIFIVINQIIDQINWNVGKLVLAKIINKEAVAIYAVAAQINSMYVHFSTAVSSIFITRVNLLVADNKPDMDTRLTELFTKIGRIQYIILMLILSGFIFFGQVFVQLWVGEGYENTYIMAILLIAPATIPLIQNIGIEIQRAKNKHQFRSYIYLAMALINVVVSIVLCKVIGMVGVAWGTTISLMVANGFIMNWYYYKKLGINTLLFWKEIIRLSFGLLIPIIVGVILNLFIIETSIISFGLCVVIYSVTYAISMYFLGINNYEKKLIHDIIKKVLKRRVK